MGVCVCAACPRPNLDSAQICVFCWLPSNQIWFAGKHNWDFNHQENINGTSLRWKIPKKVGIICISLPQIRSVQLFYLFRRFTMSQNDDPSQQCRNKHRFLRLFPISGTSKTHFSGWWLIYYNPQYYNIIIYIYMVGGFSPTPLKNMMEWTWIGMMTFPTEWKIKAMFQTTNQFCIYWERERCWLNLLNRVMSIHIDEHCYQGLTEHCSSVPWTKHGLFSQTPMFPPIDDEPSLSPW